MAFTFSGFSISSPSFVLSALPFVRLMVTEAFMNALLDSELGKRCHTFKVID